MIYTVTWRHAASFEANSAEEAEQMFELLDLGDLDNAENKGECYSQEFVEELSFEDSNGKDVGE
jgi:hypothetical protein